MIDRWIEQAAERLGLRVARNPQDITFATVAHLNKTFCDSNGSTFLWERLKRETSRSVHLIDGWRLLTSFRQIRVRLYYSSTSQTGCRTDVVGSKTLQL